MPLSPDFQFSQGSLQDYVDCPRRFQLRYLLDLAWPAVAAEPVDEYDARLKDGALFHRMIHQHVLGIGVSVPTGVEGDLATWWDNYLTLPPADLPPLRTPEITLSAPLGAHRLIAKYDLIAIEPGRRAVIVDWKTSARRPRSGRLIERLQTRVYRYLLVEAGMALQPDTEPARHDRASFQPEQIEMIYWFANYPDAPERLRYDATQHAADGQFLKELAAAIVATADEIYPLTTEVKRCLFCTYRSLCGRGVAAGDLAETDEESVAEDDTPPNWSADFSFEQIGEVAF